MLKETCLAILRQNLARLRRRKKNGSKILAIWLAVLYSSQLLARFMKEEREINWILKLIYYNCTCNPYSTGDHDESTRDEMRFDLKWWWQIWSEMEVLDLMLSRFATTMVFEGWWVEQGKWNLNFFSRETKRVGEIGGEKCTRDEERRVKKRNEEDEMVGAEKKRIPLWIWRKYLNVFNISIISKVRFDFWFIYIHMNYIWPLGNDCIVANPLGCLCKTIIIIWDAAIDILKKVIPHTKHSLHRVQKYLSWSTNKIFQTLKVK